MALDRDEERLRAQLAAVRRDLRRLRRYRVGMGVWFLLSMTAFALVFGTGAAGGAGRLAAIGLGLASFAGWALLRRLRPRPGRRDGDGPADRL